VFVAAAPASSSVVDERVCAAVDRPANLAFLVKQGPKRPIKRA